MYMASRIISARTRLFAKGAAAGLLYVAYRRALEPSPTDVMVRFVDGPVALEDQVVVVNGRTILQVDRRGGGGGGTGNPQFGDFF